MKIEQDCKYEINENLEIRIWSSTSDELIDPPFLFQPHYPDGSLFEDFNAAEQWAINWIQTRNINIEESTLAALTETQAQGSNGI